MEGHEEIQRRMIEVAQESAQKWSTAYAATVGGVQVLDILGNPHWTSKQKLTTEIKGYMMRNADIKTLIHNKLASEGVPTNVLSDKWYILSRSMQKRFDELYKDLVKQQVIRVYEVNPNTTITNA